MRSSCGQASIEYVAALALLVLVLAGTGVAVAAPDLPGAVVHQLRLALCIVGGDVCRRSDAARRGLEPCVLRDEEHARDTGVSLLFLRGSGGELWSVQRLSDGRILLSAAYGQGAGATAGVGLRLGPVLAAGGSVSGTLGFRSGKTWELPGEAALERLLERVHGYDLANRLHTFAARFPEPAETFVEGGGSGDAELAVEAVREVPGAGADARAAIGRRRHGGETTYYLDLGADSGGPVADVVPGLDAHARVLAEWRTGRPPQITLRSSIRGHGQDETETVLNLRLDDPADLAASRRVAFLDLSDPTLAMRDLLARVHARGTVQRFTYRTTTDDRSWSYGVELGARLGVDRSSSVRRRRLVEARILNGPLPARRADCLGLG